MTTEQFNSLPLEARSFIQNHAGCLACGNSASKLDRAYTNYLNSKKMATYQLFGGGINYRTEADESGVLYNIRPTDTPFEIREKIRIAKLVRAVRPHAFMVFDEEAIEALLESLPTDEVILLGEGEGEGEDEGEGTAEPLDLKTMSYEDLKAYAKANAIEVKGQSKKDYIAAIEASEELL